LDGDKFYNGKRSTLDVRNRNIHSRIKDFKRDTNMRIKVDKKMNALWPENLNKIVHKYWKKPNNSLNTIKVAKTNN
jgi:hypothetical protein